MAPIFLLQSRFELLGSFSLTSRADWGINKGMKFAVPFLGLLCLSFSACTTYDKTQLLEIVELPIKSTRVPSMAWQNTPLRAQAQYIFYGANSEKERRDRLGDYYFVTWYDQDPSLPITITMYYTQSVTGSKVLSLQQVVPAPREKAGKQKAQFFFTGKDRAKRGDILSWKMDIYAGSKLIDSKQSYLWQ